MHKLLIIPSTFLLSAISSAQVPHEPEGRPVVKLIADYSSMVGGSYINQRCNFLSTADSIDFDNNIDIITTTLGRAMGDTKTLYEIKETVKTSADSEKYAGCGSQNLNIVSVTYQNSIAWSLQIKSLQASEKINK